jgi:hypothetical protein
MMVQAFAVKAIAAEKMRAVASNLIESSSRVGVREQTHVGDWYT